MSSIEKKIISFNIEDGYEAFMNLFNEEEVELMKQSLSNYDYSDYSEEEVTGAVIVDYVKEWCITNILEGTIYGTKKLLDIIYNLF